MKQSLHPAHESFRSGQAMPESHAAGRGGVPSADGRLHDNTSFWYQLLHTEEDTIV
jgi:hypothetical protein